MWKIAKNDGPVRRGNRESRGLRRRPVCEPLESRIVLDGSLPTASYLGVLSSTRTVSDAVGPGNRNDFYRFDLVAPAAVLIDLGGLVDDANLQLIRDANA